MKPLQSALPGVTVHVLKNPEVDATVFVAAGAVVVCDVRIAAHASIWYGCVIRGDVQHISIGERSNIQDGVIIHATTGGMPTLIGADVTVGHAAVLHGCTIEDGAFIGIGARVLDGATVMRGAMLAAGAVLTPRKTVRTGELWAGNPAKLLRNLNDGECAGMKLNVLRYMALAEHYRKHQPNIYRMEQQA
ncbi:MAG TPA: gamma carbonic anhydrase family protein [Herbaspirillum sp.]|jgi:carbonic anhydrase/acetyltransferase-like protein (isoleucine patch superfamily)